MEVCTRTYTYTGGSGWTTKKPLSIPLSSFTMVGSTKKISNILSITASWKCRMLNSREMYHYAALQWSDQTLTSNKILKTKDGTYSFTSGFATLPDASKWVESDITVIASLTPTGHWDKAQWSANASNPVTITITYEGVSFEPWIRNVKMYRADETTGVAKDSGEGLSFSATVGVAETGTGGSGTLTIANGGTTVYTITGITGSTAGTAVSAIPLSGVTQASGEDITYTVTYTYTATQEGVEQSDSVSTTVYVGEIFTNVHLAAVKTGGVRFGGYSTATLDNPKFECDYPAYFYNGITIGGGSASTVSITENTILMGFLTGSTKSIYISVPVAYLSSSVTTGTVTSMVGWVRCAGKYGKSTGYVDAGDDYTDMATVLNIDHTTGTLTLLVTQTTAFNGTNNYPLTFQVKTLEIELA